VVITRGLAVVVVLAGAACSAPPASTSATASASTSTPASAANGAGSAAGADAGTIRGAVAETMNSGGYTYARLTAAGKDTWIAGNEFPVTVGDQLTAAVDMPMENFRSRTLNRNVPIIYFVREVALNGKTLTTAAGGGSMPALAGSHGGGEAMAADEPGEPALIAAVPAVPGSVMIADVWAKRAALSGKPLVLRGQIVKVNLAIMGTNWYHLQDGSGVVKDGTHDLVVTSAAELNAGDIVTVNGTLTTGKDFGAGYSYEAIVERADIRK
jgi:uncharacterized protein YfiM (DUF2279 family)